MSQFLVLLLLVPIVWSRHINEGSAVAEIVQTTESVAALDREIRSPQTAPERRQIAVEQRGAGIERVSSLAAEYPGSPAVNVAASASLLKVQEPERAEVAATRAVTAAPANPDGYLHRGRARMEMKRYDEAVKDFEETLRLRPGDPVATAGLKLSAGRGTGAAQTASDPSAKASADGATTATGASEKQGRAELEKQAVMIQTLKGAAQLYQASVRAARLGDLDEAIAKAEAAVSKAPEMENFRTHLEALTAARSKMQEAKQKAEAKPKRRPTKPLYENATRRRRWGHDTYPGEENSSQRHCVVSCIIAIEHTVLSGRGMGAINEVQGFLWHDVWQLRSRVMGRSPWAFSVQDLRNNERGFACSERFPQNEQEKYEEFCDDCCRAR